MKTYKQTMIAVACAGLTPSISYAYNPFIEHSSRMSTVIEYEIGGGGVDTRAPTPRPINMDLIDVGVSWETNYNCGDMSPITTITNTFNDTLDNLKGGFADLMENVVASATAAVTGLAAAAFMRANPTLYKLLQEGILAGKDDFKLAKTSCEELTNIAMEHVPLEKFKLPAKATKWADAMLASGGDAAQAQRDAENGDVGNEGTHWICDEVRGNTAEPPITYVSDVAKVGYNTLMGRLEADICSDDAIPSDDALADAAAWRYWKSPGEASEWARDVLGDKIVRTCDGCTKSESHPRLGLSYALEQEIEIVTEHLTNLARGTLPDDTPYPNTPANRQLASIHGADPLTAADIDALKSRSGLGRTRMIKKFATYIAIARVKEQARLMTSIMETGKEEPNIAANMGEAVTYIEKALERMKSEEEDIRLQMDWAVETRKEINKVHMFDEQRIQNTPQPVRSTPHNIDVFGKPVD